MQQWEYLSIGVSLAGERRVAGNLKARVKGRELGHQEVSDYIVKLIQSGWRAITVTPMAEITAWTKGDSQGYKPPRTEGLVLRFKRPVMEGAS